MWPCDGYNAQAASSLVESLFHHLLRPTPTRTHTHNCLMAPCPWIPTWAPLYPFNDLFSRTTWVILYQKGKTSLDFNKARDEWVLQWQWHQLDNMQTISTRRNIHPGMTNYTIGPHLEMLKTSIFCESCISWNISVFLCSFWKIWKSHQTSLATIQSVRKCICTDNCLKWICIRQCLWIRQNSCSVYKELHSCIMEVNPEHFSVQVLIGSIVKHQLPTCLTFKHKLQTFLSQQWVVYWISRAEQNGRTLLTGCIFCQ